MAASNTELAGVSMLVGADGTLIGGQDDATLNWEQNSSEINVKTDNWWRVALPGLTGWSIDVSGLWYEGATPKGVSGFGSSLGIGAAGSGTYTNLAALSEITFQLEMATRELSNQDHAGFAVVKPNIRSCTIDVTADYVDPNASNGGALQKILTAFENGDDVDFQYSFGDQGSTFSGLALPVPGSLTATGGETAQISFQLMTQGAVVKNLVGVDTGLAALFTAFWNTPPTELAVDLAVQQTPGTDTEGYDRYSGSALPTSLQITNPSDGPIQTSGSLTGSSALTRAMVPIVV